MELRIIVTGGAGFIGSNFVRYLLTNEPDSKVLNIDKLTYAGNRDSLQDVEENPNYFFRQLDIGDMEGITRILNEFQPEVIYHFAAESHVDRSIDAPDDFIHTNILGTYNLLKCVREFYQSLEEGKKETFRFLHVSTDEVYGSSGKQGYFTEETPYAPNSPYSASKASSDFLVRAWFHTYHLPVITTNCSNNYGPYQFPEKLIPVILLNAIRGQSIPIYGDGSNIRDWLYVEDHCQAIHLVSQKGTLGETYNIGGNNEITNLNIARTICKLLDEIKPKSKGSYAEQITFVQDRPGHDKRYAIDSTKICVELGWTPQEDFQSGIQKTLPWYLENMEWVNRILEGKYRLRRLGLEKSSGYDH